MENILKVVSLDWLLWIEELEEFLNKLGCDVDLEWSDFDSLVDNKLKEELVNSLEVRPRRIDLVILFNTCLWEIEVWLLHVGQRPEYVLLNHGHHIVQVWNDDRDHCFLVLKKRLNLVDGVKPVCLALDILRFILVVIVLLTEQELLLETLLGGLRSRLSPSLVCRRLLLYLFCRVRCLAILAGCVARFLHFLFWCW